MSADTNARIENILVMIQTLQNGATNVIRLSKTKSLVMMTYYENLLTHNKCSKIKYYYYIIFMMLKSRCSII